MASSTTRGYGKIPTQAVPKNCVWVNGYVAQVCVCGWLILPLENVVMFLVGAAAWNHTGVQELCTTGTTPHWQQCSTEPSQPLTSSSLQEIWLCTLTGQQVELALMARVLVS